MNKSLLRKKSGMTKVVTSRSGAVRGWQRWAPYAATVWSLIYAALGLYWALSGQGFPLADNVTGPVAGRFGPVIAWVLVIAAGIPAVAMGTAMLRGGRRLRSLLILAGTLLAAILLLFMTDLNLLVMLAYIPYIVFRLITGAEVGVYLDSLAQSQWILAHQLLCLAGGFIWLAATVSYARRSSDACLHCGRRDDPGGWTSPDIAARWCRIAVYVGMVVPVLYAITRYAWVLGIPLGMSEEYLRKGQESGMWISGLFLANFGLVGALLTLGLVQRWGEVFPRWMIGLAGQRVPMALAVVPASLSSVLFVVGGIGIWSGLDMMVTNLIASGAKSVEVTGGLIFQLGPTLLFPVWGVFLAVATLGYYFRRRGQCSICGRGGSINPGEPLSNHIRPGGHLPTTG